mmetsp:Transcript_14392/g.22902  ORF Transcript_14392/g.22902 Transcript_14392/m.22902 type:complete len:329 (+) Transcript_14392:1-987(+)
MVAAGFAHSVAVGADGRVWTWGWNIHGQLGHNDEENCVLPTPLSHNALGGAAVVLVSAGDAHTVAVTVGGAELWSWGLGYCGQLGLGDCTNRLAPVRVGTEEAFGESRVLMAACGNAHTLVVTVKGTLFSFGLGRDGMLGQNDEVDRLVPTQVEAQHFGNAKVVSAAGGATHSAAVTEHGGLYTWGKGTCVEEDEEAPMGLGHGDGESKLSPAPVAPTSLQSARVGRCHGLPQMHALAFVMGTHSRLGSGAQTATLVGSGSRSRSRRQQGRAPAAADNGRDCEYVTMPGDLVKQVVEACGVWPEGRAGELEGVVRLLGGGMINERGSK